MPMTLREGNVFTGVCHTVQEGYAWSQVPSGGDVGMPGPRSLPWGMGIPGRTPPYQPRKGTPPRKVYFPVLTSSDGYLIGGMFLTGMLPSSGFPLGLEKWEGIFQSGKSQGILKRLEKSGKITQNTGKLREFDINMSHFAYACKTEGKNGISRLISALCVNCLISIPEYSRIIDYSIIWMCIWCGLLQKLYKIKKSELLNSKVYSKV